MLHNVSVKKFLFCIWYNAMPLNLDTRTPMKMTIAGPDGASASSVAKYVFPETPANGALSCVPDATGTVGLLTWIAANVVIYNPLLGFI